MRGRANFLNWETSADTVHNFGKKSIIVEYAFDLLAQQTNRGSPLHLSIIHETLPLRTEYWKNFWTPLLQKPQYSIGNVWVTCGDKDKTDNYTYLFQYRRKASRYISPSRCSGEAGVLTSNMLWIVWVIGLPTLDPIRLPGNSAGDGVIKLVRDSALRNRLVAALVSAKHYPKSWPELTDKNLVEVCWYPLNWNARPTWRTDSRM